MSRLGTLRGAGGSSGRRRPARFLEFLIGACLVACVVALPVTVSAVPIVVKFSDQPGEGFFDMDLGPARQAAMQFAAALWGERLPGVVTVTVDAAMDSLGGSAAGALLGSAVPGTGHRDFRGAPRVGTWFVAALASQLLVPPADINGTDQVEMRVTFNGDVDEREALGSMRWYYGTDANPGSDLDFVTVALHELCHGLGFHSEISRAGRCEGGTNAEGLCQEDEHCGRGTCQRSNLGALNRGFPGAYDAHLTHVGVGRLVELDDAQRAAALLSDAVVFDGPAVRATANGPAKVYASRPPPGEPHELRGSLLAHLDPSFTPEQLMEPRGGSAVHEPDLAVAVLSDLGWASCVPAHPTAVFCSVDAIAKDLAAPLDPMCSLRCQKQLGRARDKLRFRLGTVRKAVEAAVDNGKRCREFVSGASRVASRFRRGLRKLVRRGRIAPPERAESLTLEASRLRDHLAELAQIFCAYAPDPGAALIAAP